VRDLIARWSTPRVVSLGVGQIFAPMGASSSFASSSLNFLMYLPSLFDVFRRRQSLGAFGYHRIGLNLH
jgi:hypothetical protein